MRTTTKPPVTEACGSCRAPVVVGPRTTRTRFGRQPLCDRCSTAGPAECRYGGGGIGAPRVVSDAELDRLDRWLDRVDSNRAVRDGLADADWTNRQIVLYTTHHDVRDERGRCVDCGELGPDPWLVAGDAVCADCRGGGYTETSEARTLWRAEDGTEVRGREPDGVPRTGVPYAERWWVRGFDSRSVDARGRTFAFGWGLR